MQNTVLTTLETRARTTVLTALLALLLSLPAEARANPGEYWWDFLGHFVTFDIPAPVTEAIALDKAGIAGDIPAQSDPDKNAIEVSKTADQQSGGFDSLQLTETAIKGFIECAHFCITGIQIRYDFPSSVYFTPVWRHNNADFLVQTFPSLAEVDGLNAIAELIPVLIDTNAETDVLAPWHAWATVMGDAQYTATQSLAKDMFTDTVGYDGSQVTVSDSAGSHTLQFKEAEVIGHPYVLLPYLLDTSGAVREACQTRPADGSDTTRIPGGDCFSGLPNAYAQPLRQEAADNRPDPITGEDPDWWDLSPEELADQAVGAVTESIGDYREKLEHCRDFALDCVMGELLDSSEFQRMFSLTNALVDIVDTLNEVVGVVETIAEIATLVASGGTGVSVSLKIDRYLCPSVDDAVTPPVIRPLMPYYLSGIDPMWRSGMIDMPFTNGWSFPNDVHKFDTIINPLSDDQIGTPNELWGHLYPRSGFTNHVHDAKSGMITLKRAIDIVSEPGPRTRFRLNNVGMPPGHDGVPGRYQMIYPYEMNACTIEPWELPGRTPNVHGDFMYPGHELRYAYNYWREHTCPGTTRGQEVATIELPGDGLCPFD